jgi:hypothetical protein
MAKIVKKFHYRKGGAAYDINLYNSTVDVGSKYITLKVDGAPAYAQLGPVGSTSASDMRTLKDIGAQNLVSTSINLLETPTATALPKKARYIRDWLNGSTANNGNHWVEIEVFDYAGTNIAKNKTVTSSGTTSNLTILTNEVTTSDPYANGPAGVLSWVQVDLGASYNIHHVIVWYYWADGRKYHGTKTEISEDGANWSSIFDNAVSGEYAETASGHYVDVPPNYCIPFLDCDFVGNITYANDGNWARRIVPDENAQGGVCLEIEALTDQTTWATALTLADFVPVTVGKQYIFGMRYKILNCVDNTAGSAAHTQLGVWSHWRKQDNSSNGSADYVFNSSTITAATDWQIYQSTMTAPAGTYGKNFALGTGAVKMGTRFRVDWVFFKEGTALDLYNDNIWAVRTKVEDPNMIVNGGSVVRAGSVVNLPTPNVLTIPSVDEVVVNFGGAVGAPYGRDQYTRMGHIEVIGKDGVDYGVDYGLNTNGATWTASSSYSGYTPTSIGLPQDYTIVTAARMHHMNNTGAKWYNCKWAAAKQISGLRFWHASYPDSYTWNDWPQNIQVVGKLAGVTQFTVNGVLTRGSRANEMRDTISLFANNSSSCYYGSGQNAAPSWTGFVSWTPQGHVTRYTVTISKHVTLTEVHHFRLKYGNTTACSTDGGTFTGNTISFDTSIDTVYLKVIAEDSSNNNLYESLLYTVNRDTYTQALSSYNVISADSAGASQTTRYTGTATSTTWAIGTGTFTAGTIYRVTQDGTTITGTRVDQSPAGSGSGGQTQRYFYVRSNSTSPWSGDTGTKTSSLTCADACTCNCNYCTCNCNYCTCNCNYCTCNCNYYPCSCSSCSCGTC